MTIYTVVESIWDSVGKADDYYLGYYVTRELAESRASQFAKTRGYTLVNGTPKLWSAPKDWDKWVPYITVRQIDVQEEVE